MVSATAEVGGQVELRLNFSELSSFQSHGQSFALISLACQVEGDAAWSLVRAASSCVAPYHSLCRISYVIIIAPFQFHIEKEENEGLTNFLKPDENLTLPALVQHNRGSSLPVIVTAADSTSTGEVQHAGKQTKSETTSVVTTTNIVFTTTTVLTTVTSKEAKESTVSPSNALEVLSDAERSFSSIEAASSLPLLTTGYSQKTTQVTNAQKYSHTSAPTAATSNLHRISNTGPLPTGGNTDRTTSVTMSQAKTATLDGAPITSNGQSGYSMVRGGTTQPSLNSGSATAALADPASVTITSSISKSATLTTLKPNGITVASSSTDVTAVFGNGIPQGTFTVPQSGGVREATGLKMAIAAFVMGIFLLQ
jgi:hypothetical protein